MASDLHVRAKCRYILIGVSTFDFRNAPGFSFREAKYIGVGYSKQLDDAVLGQCPRTCDGSWPVTRPIDLIAGHMR